MAVIARTLATGDPRHGTENGYSNYKCRCGDCTRAHAAWYRDYRNRHPEQREKARLRERERYYRIKALTAATGNDAMNTNDSRALGAEPS